MKNYVQEEIPARIEGVLKDISCDLCGIKTNKYGEWPGDDFNINEVMIEQKQGNFCDGGGFGTKYEVDLCSDCFKNKLVPWLVSQGANIQEQEWNC